MTYYFHLKTKILADFQICISVPLTSLCHLHPFHKHFDMCQRKICVQMQRSFVALHIHGKFHRRVVRVFIDFKFFHATQKKRVSIFLRVPWSIFIAGNWNVTILHYGATLWNIYDRLFFLTNKSENMFVLDLKKMFDSKQCKQKTSFQK